MADQLLTIESPPFGETYFQLGRPQITVLGEEKIVALGDISADVDGLHIQFDKPVNAASVPVSQPPPTARFSLGDAEQEGGPRGVKIPVEVDDQPVAPTIIVVT